MSRKDEFDYLGTQRMIEFTSPAVKIAERYNAILKPISESFINRQLIDITQPILEVHNQWCKTYDSLGIGTILESTNRINELINSSATLGLNSAMQEILKPTTLLQGTMKSMLEGLSIGFDYTTIKTLQNLSIDVSKVQEEI